MRIAFCTTCKGRTQHLRQTLPKNLADNPGSLFVVVAYGDDPELRAFLLTQPEIHTERLVVYHYLDASMFRMAHAKNLAHRLAIQEGAEILCNLDADNFTGPGFEDYVESIFDEHPNCFLWANMIKGVQPRGISGRIVCTADAFALVGGYDEKFETWSPDDKDFNQRLRLLGCEGIEIDAEYLTAVRHNDKMRFREYPEARVDAKRYYLFTGKSKPRSCVANGGAVGCGTVYRNFDYSESFRLLPYPTRIFGIGMQKTATTSLYHALKILDWPAAHWISAHWAKAIWREMNELGYSPTLERHGALCDTPIDVLYQKLDRAYPGSKFILTTRDEANWLDSVRKHWDPQYNEFRAKWDTDPFSHQIHNVIYGRKDFDAETMLARYRKHNADVKHYFRNRPNDLLVMDMDRGAGWRELCGFLGAKIPNEPYPKAYANY